MVGIGVNSRRKGVTSPSSSLHPSTHSHPHHTHPPSSPLPKPNLRSNTNTPTPKRTTRSKAPLHDSPRPRTRAADQRRTRRNDGDGDDEEEQEEENHGNDDEEDGEGGEEDEAQPSKRKSGSKSNSSPDREDQHESDSDLTPIEDSPPPGLDLTPGKSRKGGRTTPTPGKRGDITPTNKGKGRMSLGNPMTTSGPEGRERKRVVKNGQVERRRARDEKFGLGGEEFSGMTPTQSRSYTQAINDSETTSSFGDDESEEEMFVTDPGLGYESEDDITQGLPEAFAGQDIEDLAYGAGQVDIEVEQTSHIWDDGNDEEADHLIAQMSESDLDQLSQSSVHQSAGYSGSEWDSSSESDEDMDELGVPMPRFNDIGVQDDASGTPLVLMQNWDGEFVFVEPRQERSRSRRRDRGSMTNGSMSGSILSAADQPLIIDVDAVDDSSDTSSWSGLSDEDDGGDTTDSMEEEDMPVLDSPALQEIMAQRMGETAAEFGIRPSMAAPPSIIVSDTSQPETPTLSLASSTPALAAPVLQTPSAPMMGSFQMSTSDPALHAVIDDSKTATKSPFTHRRKRRQSTDAMSVASSIKPTPKRKPAPADPFTSAKRLAKRARYVSIPGHPNYVRALRAEANSSQDRETTPSDVDPADQLSLEDMLETSFLHDHEADPTDDGLHHLNRFDRVPVSTYLRRNIMSSAGRTDASSYHNYMDSSSPIVGRTGGSISQTLMGDLGPSARLLISPMLQPQLESDDVDGFALSRKEKRRRRRMQVESFKL